MAPEAGQEEKTGSKHVNLALQGGGSHGAFAWGVLDRILEDERIAVEGICGTSSGAMNAAVTAYGLTQGGNLDARDARGHSQEEARFSSQGQHHLWDWQAIAGPRFQIQIVVEVVFPPDLAATS